MAKHSTATVRTFAMLGATQRYHELRAELAALVKAFPHLRSEAGSTLTASTGRGTTASKARKRGGRLSAAGRKAIAAAQKARWARFRAKK